MIRNKTKWIEIVHDCVVTCPVCKTQVRETMCSEAPKLIYHCPACLTWLSPKKGDHCIYDSYGSVNCPPTQVKNRRLKGLPITSAGEA
jgi:uncharacterized protein (DUF2225 family)